LNELFHFDRATSRPQTRDRKFDQYFTPEWAAEELVSTFFDDLSTSDIVLEPSCGRGAILKAIPSEIQAYGVEIDDSLAIEARENTGREILVGDFRTINLPLRPTTIIGNPPFQSKLIDAFLDRAHALLPDDGRCGFILPAYICQTPRHVLKWHRLWSLHQTMLPRTLFPRASKPIIFLMLHKHRVRKLFGFALFEQAHDVTSMPKAAKLLLIGGETGKTTWRAVVGYALQSLGGRAPVEAIYSAVAPRRPSANQWWKEKVRQTLQRHFSSTERGVWSLAE
jgi:adenine-specific DNA-methyltransferase